MSGIFHAMVHKTSIKNFLLSTTMLALAMLSGCAAFNTSKTESSPATASNVCQSSTDTFCLEGDKDKAARLNRQGLEYAAKKDYDKALDYFKQAIEIDHFDPEFYYNLGVTYDEKNMKNEAETAYMKVLSIEPDNPKLKLVLGNTYYNLACLYALQGKKDMAFGFLEKLFEVDPNIMYHYAQTDSDLDSLRDEPRYKQIMAMRPGSSQPQEAIKPQESSQPQEAIKPQESSQPQEASKPEEFAKTPQEAVKSKKAGKSKKTGKSKKATKSNKPSTTDKPENPGAPVK